METYYCVIFRQSSNAVEFDKRIVLFSVCLFFLLFNDEAVAVVVVVVVVVDVLVPDINNFSILKSVKATTPSKAFLVSSSILKNNFF
jgi:hypothetical protein